jgi:hypothetical protein
LLEAVVSYLRDKPADYVAVPKFIGRAINESEIGVTTALRLLQEVGIAKQWFGVLCSERDVPLAQFAALEDLPKEIRCDDCDTQHSLADGTCKVEVYYTVDHEKLAGFNLRDMAA